MLNNYLLLVLLLLVGPTDGFLSYFLVPKVKAIGFYRNILLQEKPAHKNTESISSSQEAVSESLMEEVENELKAKTKNTLGGEALLRLKVEASDPFRPLRNYLYLAMAGGGSLGAIISLPQLVKLLLTQQTDAIQSPLTNLVINIAGAAGGTWLILREKKKEKEKLEKLRKIEQRNQNQLTSEEIDQREKVLNMLPVEILLGVNKTIQYGASPLAVNSSSTSSSLPASETSQYYASQLSFAERRPTVETKQSTRIVSINDLREKGDQSIVIVSGDLDFVRKCLMELRLRDQEEFSRENIIVIPFCIGAAGQQRLEDEYDQGDETAARKGFQVRETAPSVKRRSLEVLSAAYIGRPKQLNVWKRVMELEFDLAEKQGNMKSRKQGISILLSRKGKVIRRGIGIPLWDSVVKEFRATKD